MQYITSKTSKNQLTLFQRSIDNITYRQFLFLTTAILILIALVPILTLGPRPTSFLNLKLESIVDPLTMLREASEG